MINMRLDDGGARVLLQGLAQSTKDLRPFFEDAHNIFIAMEKEQFASEGAYSGERWEPLNPRYAEKKARDGYSGMQIMQRERRLFESLTQKTHAEHVYAFGSDWVEMGTRVLYARAQHFGYEPRNLPARSLIRITKAEGERLVDALLAHILGSTRRSTARLVRR